MSLFKILHGDEERISTDITPFHEGWCYVTHNGRFFVDMNIGTKESPNYQRVETTSRSAYQIAKENGFEGTEQEWLKSLDGKNAYQYAQDGGYTGTEAEFARLLTGVDKANKLEVASYFTPEMYYNANDPDDTASIQRAIDNAGKTGVVYLGKKTYNTSSPIEFAHSKYTFICDGTISYSGTDAAIKMNKTTMTNIDIYAIEAPNGTALLVDSTAGEIGNCIVYINYIFSSVIGVHLKGDGGEGVSGHNIFYNKFHMEGCITSTNTCIYIEPITSLINENYFWVGRLYGGASYGIRVNAKDTFGGSAVNGNASRNVFYGGNFEGISSNGYSVHLHNSSLNIFRNFRTEEACGKYVIGLSGECYGNDIGLSRIYLKEVDISTLTDSGEFANILRSTQIVGLGDDNLSRQNKILVTTDGFSSETSDIAKSLQTETWIFTLKDGTTVEKQVAIS